ncbi:MAG: hypothetical protein ACRD2E_05755 [Terriglobales bacterium]
MDLPTIQTSAALLVTALVLAASFLAFADYYLHGRRARNPSSLFSAAGFFLLTISLLASHSVLRALRVLAWPGPRFATFLAGCLFLFIAIGLYVYLTYFRPGRLQFEEESARLPRYPEEGDEPPSGQGGDGPMPRGPADGGASGA